MTHCKLRQDIVRRLAVFSLVAVAGLAAVPAARAVNLVQDFYLPLPESQIYTANSAIVSGTGSTIDSTFSIVVTGDGTQIYYDQWEDGYETNLASPAQSTTQVWGDGNDANGIPPGFAHDPLGLTNGTVITLTNNVTLPRNPSTILWDARDHIAANKALVISRAAWPIPTGPVFAGSVSVLSTIDYGTNYISPVGQNLTNNLFKYVGMSIMAAQNNTAVTIDPTGTNGAGLTNIVLNQGESYLVNGGILKGGRVTSTKGIQADIIIGHVGASYASDWFTLYPVSEWSSSYYTPVGSAATVNQPAYVYLYNPNTNAITINYTTKVGAGSFSVPGTNGVYQYQMPVGSGASFVCTNGSNFYALCTVAANNTADTAYNWGFTLVPQGALTTEAHVGWGPGSADGTVDGSPVWVTALASTTLYVDYKGDHAGLLAYTNAAGIIQNYDTNFTVTALQSLKIFDPSKNQTGMRIFTVDGTLITAAWGEDPDTAQPGNPYIDAGTTVIPFPVPTLIKTVAIIATNGSPTTLIGDTLLYTVQVDNKGLLPLGNTVVIDTPTTNLTYVTNSTAFNGAPIPDNPGPYSSTNTAFPLDAFGSVGYTIPVILSQGTSIFTYQVKVIAGGVVSNSVNIGGTTITTQTYLTPPPASGASVTLNFSTSGGVPTNSYVAGANAYVTMTNAVGNTASNTVQTINVTVTDTNTGDLETITLVETSTNSGVFRNTNGLPTSTSSGLAQQDGILNVKPGDTLSVSYTDPNYGDSATSTATISIPTPNKQLYFTANGTPGNQFMDRKNPAAYPGFGTTNISANLGTVIGSAVVSLVATNTTTNAAGPVTITNVTVGNLTNRLLLVAASFNPPGANGITGITYGGVALSLVKSWRDTANTGNAARAEIWALLNPGIGTSNVVITFNGAASDITAGAMVYSGVDQTTPFSHTNTADGNSATPSITIASVAGEQVFNVIACRTATTCTTTGTGQVRLWGFTNPQVDPAGGGSLTPGAASVTNSWSATGGGLWASIAVSIKLAVGSNGTNVTSFAQTPAFTAPFTMPAGGVVSITNFITITNGSLPANPNITATLQYGGTNFITLTNAAYANNTLVWSGTLATNVTISTNQSITDVISNFQSTATFHVNFDATNVPSVIVLPASTVINIVSNGVYDAPYPGGNLINSPVAGSTVYLRTTVSDPFGYYDITSLGVVVTGPVGFSTNLTDANTVFTNGAVKIYQYALTTGPATGTYNIAVTANEGTEGVNVSTATSITTTFLDLGTPSITQFTAGPNGVSTNSYPANGLVSVRVTDLNRNTNAATVDAVSVLVTNSAGDFETLTLVETGTNTGIFTNSINASSTVVGAPNNGTLYAPVGSILTVYYSDPTDLTDNTSATATVQPPPGVPGVVMNKTILSPSGGQVGVSNNITFNLQAVNVGSTNLPNLSISDTFPSAKLSFVSASIAPGITNAGLLTWTNLGVFAPGQSTNISVTFLALATGATTNFATANGVLTTNSGSVTFAINKTALNVTKILLSPTNTPVAVGSNVVFRITVQNTGNVTVNYLPLEDTFSAAYYQFVSSTVTNNGSGAGSLIWTNLASPAALVAGATITNDVTMKVVGQGSPANNTATVDYATDINGNPVPTTTSTIGVNTASASINGHVYNDTNQSGVFTNGDTGLANVTLTLYTDPNGDGNPADGTLVQIVTTDANGYYELLNLGIGHYVAVETLLPGYVGSAPPNNRLAFNLTTLTASTNNNFFQYVPSPSVYSTISGSVWYDSNGNGTNNAGETNLPNIAVSLVQDVNSNGIADAGEPVVSSTPTDANGNYSLPNITPGHYVIQQTLPYGYYSTGDSQGTTNSQISFVSTNAVVSTNNNFYDRLSPIAVNDSVSALYLVATNIYPLTNDISPNGDALTIVAAISTNGIVAINSGSTNITFTPTNTGIATITYTISDGHGGASTAVITVNVAALANLGIGKTATNTVFATSNLSYTISVTNFGSSGASSVVVTDALPAGVSFVSASGGGVSNNNAVVWSLGTLTNSQITNLNLTVTAPVAGSLTNTANVSSPTPDPNLTNNVTPPVVTAVTPVTDIVVLNAGPTNVVAGTVYTNTISVTNAGPSTATNVVVVDTRPNGTTVTNTYPVLAAGVGTNFIVTYTAPGSGPLTNSATGTSGTFDPNLGNNTNILAVTAVTLSADLAIGKSSPSPVTYGTNFNYTISVTNLGASLAGNLFVTDSLPAGLVFISASPGWTTNGSQVVWTNLVNLASGATTNLTLTVFPTASGIVTNFANVGSPTLDPNPTNNTSPPTVTTIAKAPLTIIAGSTNKVYNTTLVLGSGQSMFTGAGLVNNETIGSVTLASTGATNTAPVGSYPLIPSLATGGTFNPANYGLTYSNGTLTVSQGIYTTGWPTNANMVYGTPLGTSQNDATATVPGTFNYNPTNGVILPVGTNQLTVIFTPTDTNYPLAHLTNTVVVTPAPLTIIAGSTNKVYNTTLVLGSGQSMFTGAGLVNNETIGSVTLASTGATNTAPVGSYPLIPSLATGGTFNPANYGLTYSNGTLTVSQGIYTTGWPTNANMVYGTPLGTGQNDATATVPGTFNYNPTNGVILPVGTNQLTVIFTPTDTNYPLAHLTNTVVVTPAPLTIIAGSTNKVYNTTLVLGSGQSMFTGVGLVNNETIGSVTLASGGAVNTAPVGTYSIVPSLATGGTFNPANYGLTYSNGTLTVSQGIYTTGWPTNANMVYGTPLGTGQNDATATVPGTFNYNPTNGVILPVGTNQLTVIFTPTDTNYPLAHLTNTVVVTPAPLTIIAGSTNKVYNTTLVLGSGQSMFTGVGLVNNETVGSVTLASGGAVNTAPVGSYPLTPSLATGGTFNPANYSLTYSNGVLTVTLGIYTTGWPTNANMVYGTPLGTGQNDATATVPGTFNYNPTNGVILPVGTNQLTVIFTPTDTNYPLAHLTNTVVVTPAPLTIIAGSTNKVYNTTLVLGSGQSMFTGVGLVNNETIGSVTLASGGAVNTAPVGTYSIVPSLATGGTFNPANYGLTYSNGTLTVSQGIYTTGWPTNANMVYGTPLGTGQNDATATVPGTFNYNPTNGVILPVGTNQLTVIFTPTDTNYPLAHLTNTVVVTPAPLTIIAGSTNKVYNTTLVLGSGQSMFTGVGLVNNETVGSVTLASGGAVNTAPVGSYPLTPSLATGGTFNPANYSLTYSNGVLTVTLGIYTTNWPAVTNIVYGTPLGTGQNDATATVPGTFNYNPTNGVILPVGTNQLTTVFTPTDTNYPAASLTNYVVVTAAPLTIFANSTNKVYNTTLVLGAGQTAFTSVGLVNNETVGSVTLASGGAVNTAPVGSYPLTPSLATGGTFNPANYSLTYSNGVLTVTLGIYTTNWPAVTNIVYGTPLGTGQNDATATVPGTFDYNPTNGVILPVGTNQLTTVFTPTDTNYPAASLTNYVVVTAAPLTIFANSTNKVYNTTLVLGAGQTAFTSVGLVNNETVGSVTLASGGAVNTAPVGSYPLTPSLATGGTFNPANYSLTYSNGVLTVTNIVAVGADVRVILSGPALVTVGDAFSFTTEVTNAGPLTATNTFATNALSANLTVANVSGGGVSNNGVVTWPVFPLLANGQATNLTVTVKTAASGSTISSTANPYDFILTNNPPVVGSATNRASAFASTFDPNLTNNTASSSYTNAQTQTLIVPGVFSIVMETNTYPTNAVSTNTVIPIGTGLFIVGTSAFNPQTQLYEEFVSVTNIGQAPVHALRLSIGGLRSGVTLYNSTGTNNGVPFVEYDPPYNSPLNPYPQAGNSVTFTLEFFVADRRPFTNSLTAMAIPVPVTAPAVGTPVNIIQSGFNDVRNPANPRFLVEFTSIPGRTYTVEYSDDDMVTWNLAVPSIVASTTSTFWYDDGPPVTLSPPSYPNSSRFYRVLLNP